MTVLRIQHPVPDYDRWKRAFDLDPADRRGSGVIRYTILRSVTNPNFVMVDLELGSVREAEKMLLKMRRIWTSSGSSVMIDPEAWIVDVAETAALV
ncbi:hypothetical protein E3O53_12350 [Cryobacterium sp. TMT2-18-3]|uniref:hypothetical protein n=1 Tax=unclassified Cryobacterium TaxID=2649013 RepID=UPI00106A8EF0|nr:MULTISPECIES: hypothetical protein [unclassified Cryobacterium]TFC29395.1 hypothetical protein E3O22_06475 [Cryobacterium sp. TMT2-18-2]TFC35732.1 hypothetical protein E3O18_08740 [Cryobacterium sp. TMT2-42-4]TFC62793.1 hypothetical protein E3O53_12350 [Cryobacterium sp. TMT2-18-3]TFC62806.1 hypothetical protein E3O62_03605 [Cryobacterium sp. TMT2-15-1]